MTNPQQPEPMSAEELCQAVIMGLIATGNPRANVPQTIALIKQRDTALIAPHLARIERLEEALIQILDDARYIKGYHAENDEPIYDDYKEDGGSFCHQAALMARQALNTQGQEV